MRFGDKLPAGGDSAGSADALVDLMRALPAPAGGHGLGPNGPSLANLASGLVSGLGGPSGHGGPGLGPNGPSLGPSGPGYGPLGAPPFGPTGGGSDTDAYSWKQDNDEIELSVSVPAAVSKGDVKVLFLPKGLKVQHRGETLVEGSLAGCYRPEGSTWTLSKGRVVVSLEKATSRPWPSVFKE